MPQRSGLGKGLDALIPVGGSVSDDGGTTQVGIDSIQRNPHQPRQAFKEGELEELAISIREYGVIQPLIVAPAVNGTFTLIAGERRWQAARRAGLKNVPVVIRNATDQQYLELALIENVQRADLNPIEEAEAFHHLIKEFGLSQENVASRIGKSRVTITNTLRLLDASSAVKQALVDERITEGHARALLSLHSSKAQEAALHSIISLGLNVRQAEQLTRKLGGQKPVSKKKVMRNPSVGDIERRLRTSLGTKVALKHGKNGGSLTIYYYSDEELDALLKKLL